VAIEDFTHWCGVPVGDWGRGKTPKYVECVAELKGLQFSAGTAYDSRYL